MSPSAGLTDLPAVDVLRLGTVTAVPEFHPLHGTGQPFPVHGFVVHHPDGPVVVAPPQRASGSPTAAPT